MKLLCRRMLPGISGLLCAMMMLLAGGQAQRAWGASNDGGASPSDEIAAKQFLDMLVLDHDAMNRTNLFRRPTLVAVSKLYHEKKYLEAVALFEQYYFQKLRNPGELGMKAPQDDGFFNDQPMPEFTPFHSTGYRSDRIIKPADALMKGQWLIQAPPWVHKKDRVYRVGEPGQVNWDALKKQVKPTWTPDKQPDRAIWSGSMFNSLIQAYLYTGKEAYLGRWIAYMNDWTEHCNEWPATVKPYFVPDSNSGGAFRHWLSWMGKLSQSIAPEQVTKLIPPAAFARMMRKYVRDFPILHILYMRADTHNWTPDYRLLSVALWLDEFKVAPYYFREELRRCVEDPWVTQGLPDGTATQLDPWYNGNYLHVSVAPKVVNARKPVWFELPWVRDVQKRPYWADIIQEHVGARVNFLLHLRTPQNHWPAVINAGEFGRSALPYGGGSWSRYAPKVTSRSVNRKIILATVRPDLEVHPDYTADAFPYAGFYVVRDGWKPTSGHAALFCAPHPAGYGAYRGRSNNNMFGLNVHGKDILTDDDTTGHYTNPTSPILVDGMQQYFNAGVYKVPGAAGHKVYQVVSWWEPPDWRWYAGDNFNVMEGVYSGPWYSKAKSTRKPMPISEATTGITHHRLALHVRDADLWILTDRMLAKGAHHYQQLWQIRVPPQDVHADEGSRSIITNEKDQPNISMFQFAAMPFKYELPKDPDTTWRATAKIRKKRRTVRTAWTGSGDQQIVTAIVSRDPGQAAHSKIRAIEQIRRGPHSVGFKAVMTGGKSVEYIASRFADDTLTLGKVRIKGQALLLEGDHGIALNCKAMSIDGKVVKVEYPNFVFTIDGSALGAVSPIYRPIQRVIISPNRNVFVGEQKIAMTCPTPGVEIRYTLDGSDPTPQSTLYKTPFTIDRTVRIRARAYRPGVTENPVNMAQTQATVPWNAVYTKDTPAAATPTRNTQPGLAVNYYQDHWRDMMLNLDELKPQATGVARSLFDLNIIPASNPRVDKSAPAPRQKPYTLVYSGYLNVPADGIYTLHAPYEYVWPDVDACYELNVYVGQHKERRSMVPTEWYPSTMRHGFGTWSVALKKGAHPFKVVYIDYRMDGTYHTKDGVEKLNVPGLKDYIWTGVTPKLTITGPGIDKPEAIPSTWLEH